MPSPILQHSFGYDGASRLQTVTDNSGATPYSATYTYLANSPLVSQIAFQQSTTMRMTTTKQWDYLNRLQAVSAAPSAGFAVNCYELFWHRTFGRTAVVGFWSG
jgi:hypothetical protein